MISQDQLTSGFLIFPISKELKKPAKDIYSPNSHHVLTPMGY